MIKVIIVDDLYYFRKALISSIDWNSLGFEVCGEANNGLDAYNLIKELNPEIAIVDINMPGMDGLGLAARLKEEGIKTRIIIVTGYSEFEYAKQAVKLGTFNYILKPVDNEELIKSLLELKLSIENEKNMDNKIKALREELKKNIPVLRGHFFLELVTGVYKDKSAQILDKFCYFDVFQNSSVYRVILIDMDSKIDDSTIEEDRQLWKFAITNIVDELLANYKEKVIFSDSNDRICLILGGSVKDNETGNVSILCEKIRYSIEHYLKFTVTLGVGDLYSDCCGIEKSYNEAKMALESRFFLGRNRVIFFNELNIEQNDKYFVLDIREELLVNLRLGNIDEINKKIDALFAHLREREISAMNIYAIYIELSSLCISFIAENSYTINEVLDMNPLDVSFENMVIDEVQAIVKKMYSSTINFITENKNKASKKVIEEAIKYIKSNYSTESLCLKDIASSVYVNPTYLSSIFKKETGKTIHEYITDVRMNKAKELLDEGMCSLANVSERVGYTDPNYFSKCFKKYFGVSPSNYINMKRS